MDFYNKVYKKVENFTDLLETNIKFFNRDIPCTYYYGATWGDGKDQNNHAIVSTKNLIELTQNHRIFTINGQSSYTNMNEEAVEEATQKIEKIEKDIKNHRSDYFIFAEYFDDVLIKLNKSLDIAFENLKKEHNKITMQRSYLEFFIEESTYDSIIDKLIKDNRIWYCIIKPNYKIVTNIKTRKISLTDEYTIFTVDTEWREYEKSGYPNIDCLLDKLYLCIIVCRDFGTPYTADDILLEIVKE